VDTDTIYSDLHISETPPGAPQALRPREGRGPGLAAGDQRGGSGAGPGSLAACGGSLSPRRRSGVGEGVRFSAGESMFDALGEGWAACQGGQKHPR